MSSAANGPAKVILVEYNEVYFLQHDTYDRY